MSGNAFSGSAFSLFTTELLLLSESPALHLLTMLFFCCCSWGFSIIPVELLRTQQLGASCRICLPAPTAGFLTHLSLPVHSLRQSLRCCSTGNRLKAVLGAEISSFLFLPYSLCGRAPQISGNKGSQLFCCIYLF